MIRQWRSATYNIKVQNPSHIEKGVASITVNGKLVKGNVVPQQPAGSVNDAIVVMG